MKKFFAEVSICAALLACAAMVLLVLGMCLVEEDRRMSEQLRQQAVAEKELAEHFQQQAAAESEKAEALEGVAQIKREVAQLIQDKGNEAIRKDIHDRREFAQPPQQKDLPGVIQNWPTFVVRKDAHQVRLVVGTHTAVTGTEWDGNTVRVSLKSTKHGSGFALHSPNKATVQFKATGWPEYEPIGPVKGISGGQEFVQDSPGEFLLTIKGEPVQ